MYKRQYYVNTNYNYREIDQEIQFVIRNNNNYHLSVMKYESKNYFIDIDTFLNY